MFTLRSFTSFTSLPSFPCVSAPWRLCVKPNSTIPAIRATLTSVRQPPTLRRMDSLHAPWRIQYILAPKPPVSDVSLFTRVSQSNDDVGNHVIVRDRTCFAMLNAYPYTGGHLLIAPYKQVEDFGGLMDDELLDLMKLTRRAQNVLTRVMKPDGFNIGVNLGRVAGAGIAEHLHIHIVPRWNGDTNFMPVLAGATVVPEALTDLAAKLRRAFNEE